ncbi:MAG: protein-disulfide reductase DsbD [Pseudomonadota bacterium]
MTAGFETGMALLKNTMRRWQMALGILLVPITLTVGAAEFEFDSDDAWLSEEEEFLHVDEAFKLNATLSANGVISADWRMPDGYYLYRHRFGFETKSADLVLSEPSIPPGKKKVDEYFGDVEVYYHDAQMAASIVSGHESATQIGINYQGCADHGLCYPPEVKWFEYSEGSLIPVSAGVSADVISAAPSPVESTSAVTIADTEETVLASILADESLIYALALFFLAGIGLAFTPCVLPMVPILSSIIVGEGEDISKKRAFSLSFAYVMGMAVTYAFVGTLVGLFGAELNLQAALQSAPVLIFFAVVFVILSLAMFGFYELQMPQSWQDRLNQIGQKQEGGKHLSVVIMGSVSSLVVSPCVSAPLAGALIYISTTSDAVLGGSALLALGLGMGVPLLIVGGSGGHWLPRAGNWMNTVKAIFGVMLLAVAVWLLERVVPATVTLALWAALLLGSGVFLGVMDSAPRQGMALFGKAVGTMGFVWGVLLLIGSASGASDPFKPLAKLQFAGTAVGPGVSQLAHAEGPPWQAVKSLADVEAYIAASPQPVILDLYADWCISCKTMERSVFPVNDVASRLSQFTLLRADVTANDEIDKELLTHYGLFGPPSLVFFEGKGGEIKEVRIQGEIDADRLAAHLAGVLAKYGNPNAGKIGEIAAISP